MAKKREATLKFVFDAQGGIAQIERVDQKLKGVGNTAGRMDGKVSKLGATFRTALGVAAVAGVAALTAALANLARNGIALLNSAYTARGIQEIAEGRLSQALKNLGVDSREVEGRLIAQAGALQKLTNFGDEQIITSQAILASFRELAGPEGIELLTPRVLDLAAGSSKATGETMDLNTAALVLGRAMTQGAGALSRYGISMSEAQKTAFGTAEGLEKVALLAEIVDDNFGGMSETMVDELKQMQNAAGDLLEEIGRGLRPELQGLFAEVEAGVTDARAVELANQIGDVLGGAIESVTSFIKENRGTFLEFGGELGEVVQNFLDLGQAVSTAVGRGEDGPFGVFSLFIEAITDHVNNLNLAMRGTLALFGQLETPLEKLQKLSPSDFAKAHGPDALGGFLRAHDPVTPAPTPGPGSGPPRGKAAPANPGIAEFIPTSISDFLGNPEAELNRLSAALGLEEDLPVILGVLRELGDGAEVMADRWEAAGERMREAEDQKRQALEQTLATQIGAVDTTIRSTSDIVDATLAGTRQIVQAKLAESIASHLAAAGPAAIFVAPFIGATLNALFNRLLPSGSGGISSSTGGLSGSYTDRGYGSQFSGGLPGSSRGVPSGRSSGDVELVREVRAVGEAILGKEWTVEGYQLTTLNRRNEKLHKRAGLVR